MTNPYDKQEDKDQMKRERDRISFQLEALTQECSDARETAHQHAAQLQADCTTRMEDCQGRANQLNTQLTSCRASKTENGDLVTQCNEEVGTSLI